jgi:hypothetical protein
MLPLAILAGYSAFTNGVRRQAYKATCELAIGLAATKVQYCGPFLKKSVGGSVPLPR